MTIEEYLRSCAVEICVSIRRKKENLSDQEVRRRHRTRAKFIKSVKSNDSTYLAIKKINLRKKKGRRIKFSLHHILPRWLGGADNRGNFAYVDKRLHHEIHKFIQKQLDEIGDVQKGKSIRILIPVFDGRVWVLPPHVIFPPEPEPAPRQARTNPDIASKIGSCKV